MKKQYILISILVLIFPLFIFGQEDNYWVKTLELINLDSQKQAIKIITSYNELNSHRNDPEKVGYEADILSIIVNYRASSNILSSLKYKRLLEDNELEKYPKLRAALNLFYGKTLKDKGKTKEALLHYELAEDLLNEIVDAKLDISVFKIMVGNSIAEIQFTLDRNIAANIVEEHYNKAMALEDSPITFLAKSQIINFQATIKRFNRKEEKALELIQNALDLSQRFLGENHIDNFVFSYNQASTYFTLGDYDESLVHFGNSLPMVWDSDRASKESLFKLYNAIGIVLNTKSQYGASLTLKEAANNLSSLSNSILPVKVAGNYQMMATTQLMQFDTYGALESLNKAKEIILTETENKLAPDLQGVYLRLADLYVQKEEWDSVVHYANKAIDVCNKNYDDPSFFIVGAQNTKVIGLIGQKKYKKGKQVLNSMNISGKGMQSSSWIRYYSYSNIALGEKEYDKAIDYINKAIQIFFPDFNPNNKFEPPTFSTETDMAALNILGFKTYILHEIYKDSKESKILDYASKMGDFTISFWANNRNSALEPDVKIAVQGNRKVIEDCIQINLTQYELSKDKSYLEKAFRYANYNKGLLLNDANKKKDAFWGNIGLTNRIIPLQNQINLLKLRINKTESAKVKELLYRELIPLMIEQTLLYDEVKKEKPLNVPVEIPYISDVQDHLSKDEVVVLFYGGQKNYYVFIIDKEEVGYEIVPNRKELDDISSKTFSLLVDNGDLKEYVNISNLLYKKILKNVLSPYTSGTTLHILRDGYLQLIPLDLLVSNIDKNGSPTYLLEDYPIIYKNTLLKEEAKSVEINESRILAFSPFSNVGNNDAAIRGLDNSLLKGTDKEINQLKDIFKVNHFNGDDASKQNLLDKLDENVIVHLATHSIENLYYPDKSYIAFTNAQNEQTSKLFSYEIQEMELSSPMVVLSSCYSAKGKIYQGEGMTSLARAFFTAGAESVIASKWAASDIPTSKIIGKFYKNLNQGMKKSRALQLAKMDFMKNSSNLIQHPHYWGSLVIMGDNTNISIADKSLFKWWHILIVITLFLLAIPVLRRFL